MVSVSSGGYTAKAGSTARRSGHDAHLPGPFRGHINICLVQGLILLLSNHRRRFVVSVSEVREEILRRQEELQNGEVIVPECLAVAKGLV